MDTVLEVLKWVALILLAGFIGQFGKSLSLAVLHYFKNKKVQKTPPPPAPEERAGPPSPSPQPVPLCEGQQEGSLLGLEKERAKIEKKRLKAELKAKKKSEK